MLCNYLDLKIIDIFYSLKFLNQRTTSFDFLKKKIKKLLVTSISKTWKNQQFSWDD